MPPRANSRHRRRVSVNSDHDSPSTTTATNSSTPIGVDKDSSDALTSALSPDDSISQVVDRRPARKKKKKSKIYNDDDLTDIAECDEENELRQSKLFTLHQHSHLMRHALFQGALVETSKLTSTVIFRNHG